MLPSYKMHGFSDVHVRFVASPSGTHLWHSHSGTQRMDGLMGPLVVRQSPSRELHRALYDYDLPEHVIMMNDWVHDVSMERFTAYHHRRGNNKPSSILINGIFLNLNLEFSKFSFEVENETKVLRMDLHVHSVVCV